MAAALAFARDTNDDTILAARHAPARSRHHWPCSCSLSARLVVPGLRDAPPDSSLDLGRARRPQRGTFQSPGRLDPRRQPSLPHEPARTGVVVAKVNRR